MRKVEVCLSPELLHLHKMEGKTVVVVDILRATSCLITGLAHGADHILPVSNLEKCMAYRDKGYLIAGERNGQKVEGFDMGNSPFEYMREEVRENKIAVTTTNGTRAIEASREADEIIVGSFLNLKSAVDYIESVENNVLVLCAGWKGAVNLEDTLYAGALVDALSHKFEFEDDASTLSKDLYVTHRNNLVEIISNSSHAKRLNSLKVFKDIEFCVSIDKYEVVGVIVDGQIESR